MSAIILSATEKEAKYQQILEGFKNDNDKKSSLYAWMGAILILLGVLLSFLAILQKDAGKGLIGKDLYWIFGLSGLAIIGGIVCLSSGSKCNQAANHFRTEIIVLRDLGKAISLADAIDPKDVKDRSLLNEAGDIFEKDHVSRRTKAKELVIQTLLNRCGR